MEFQYNNKGERKKKEKFYSFYDTSCLANKISGKKNQSSVQSIVAAKLSNSSKVTKEGERVYLLTNRKKKRKKKKLPLAWILYERAFVSFFRPPNKKCLSTVFFTFIYIWHSLSLAVCQLAKHINSS